MLNGKLNCLILYLNAFDNGYHIIVWLKISEMIETSIRRCISSQFNALTYLEDTYYIIFTLYGIFVSVDPNILHHLPPYDTVWHVF